MWSIIAAKLAPYAIRIAVTLAVVLAIVSGYFYWKHEVQADQHKEDMAKLADRNAKEKEESDKVWNDAVVNVVKERQNDQENYERTIKSYANIIAASRVIGVRDKSRVATAKSDNCPTSGKTDISEGSAGTYGRTGEEIPELAGLCLLAADEIRRTHVIR